MDRDLINVDDIYQWYRHNCHHCLLAIDFKLFEISSNYHCKIEQQIDEILISTCDDFIPVKSVSNLFEYQKNKRDDHCINHHCPYFVHSRYEILE